VLRQAFGPLGLPAVWSMTAELNTPSQAVMRRIGLRLHTRFEHPAPEPGSPLRPHVMYRSTAAERAGRVAAEAGRDPGARR
jgi:RimJ/RimL family protein N-acetyltransferase